MSLDKNRRLNESTPLENRDEVAAFEAEKAKEEAASSSEKYAGELKKRNSKYYEAWKNFFTRINNVIKEASGSDLEGYSSFIKEEYVPCTGNFDSATFRTSDEVGYIPNSQGIAIYLWGASDGPELGGGFYDEFIPKVKKHGGVELILAGFWALNPDSDRYDEIMDYNNRNPKQVINLHVQDMMSLGLSRKDVAAESHFLNKLIQENDVKKEFPGCTRAYPDLEGHDEIDVMVFFNISPLPTKEEISNVVSAVKKLTDNMCQIGNLYFDYD